MSLCVTPRAVRMLGTGVARLEVRLRSLDDLPHAIEQALAPEPSATIARRAHFRDLLLQQPAAEVRISALVRERLA